MVATFEGFAPRRSEATGAHAQSAAVIPQHGPVWAGVDVKRRAPGSRTCPLRGEPGKSGGSQDAHKAGDARSRIGGCTGNLRCAIADLRKSAKP